MLNKKNLITEIMSGLNLIFGELTLPPQIDEKLIESLHDFLNEEDETSLYIFRQTLTCLAIYKCKTDYRQDDLLYLFLAAFLIVAKYHLERVIGRDICSIDLCLELTKMNIDLNKLYSYEIAVLNEIAAALPLRYIAIDSNNLPLFQALAVKGTILSQTIEQIRELAKTALRDTSYLYQFLSLPLANIVINHKIAASCKKVLELLDKVGLTLQQGAIAINGENMPAFQASTGTILQQTIGQIRELAKTALQAKNAKPSNLQRDAFFNTNAYFLNPLRRVLQIDPNNLLPDIKQQIEDAIDACEQISIFPHFTQDYGSIYSQLLALRTIVNAKIAVLEKSGAEDKDHISSRLL